MKNIFFSNIINDFSKAFNIKKTISLILIITFLSTNISYGIDIEATSLRVPVGSSIKRAGEVLDLIEVPQRDFKASPEREINERVSTPQGVNRDTKNYHIPYSRAILDNRRI